MVRAEPPGASAAGRTSSDACACTGWCLRASRAYRLILLGEANFCLATGFAVVFALFCSTIRRSTIGLLAGALAVCASTELTSVASKKSRKDNTGDDEWVGGVSRGNPSGHT